MHLLNMPVYHSYQNIYCHTKEHEIHMHGAKILLTYKRALVHHLESRRSETEKGAAAFARRQY